MRSTLSTIPSFVRSRLSFSFFFSRTPTPSFLAFPLSPLTNPCQPSLITLHHDQSDSPPHPCLRCPILAASSSLPRPRCLIHAASSSLPYPCRLVLVATLPSLARCIVIAPTPHLRTPLGTLLTLINRPLQVLLSPPTSGTPSFLLLFESCPLHCLLAEQVPVTSHYRSHAKIRQTDRMKKSDARNERCI